MLLLGLLVCFLAGTLLSVSFLLLLLCLAIRRLSQRRLNNYGTRRNIAVLVVGDLGRSPRMQNHALCISKRFCCEGERHSGKPGVKLQRRSGDNGSGLLQDKINNNHVFLVGYDETSCGSAITNDKHITLLGIGTSCVDQYREVLPLWIFLLAKVLEQSFKVFIAMMRIPNLSGILLQVPPSIPSIPVSLLVSFLRGAPLIIDWHNYGHTLLISDAGGTPPSSIIVRMYRRVLVAGYRVLEFYLGRLAHSSFCVSKAMQKDLRRRGIQATVVYDRPNGGDFRPLESVSKRHSVLFKYFGHSGKDGGDRYCPAMGDRGTHNQGVPPHEEGKWRKQKQKSRELQRHAQKGQNRSEKAEESPVARGDSPLTRVVDMSSKAGAGLSVLEGPEVCEEINKQLRERKRASTKGSQIPESLREEEFFLEIKPQVLDEISPSFKEQDLRQLLTRDDLFLDNEVFETSPVTELGLSYDQVSNKISLKVGLRRNRPAVLITSTSWTPDEDLNLLLEGLVEYDRDVSRQTEKASPSERLPDVFLIITGKGPNKQSWLEKASRTTMRHVEIRTVFAEADDYPRLLASSDLGISMHFSSSGLDLPMKVVDMLGTGIPVISFSYPTIAELLRSGDKLELFFSDSRELCSRLTSLLRGFDSSCEGSLFPSPILNKISRSNSSRRSETFYQEWTNTAMYHFDEMVI